MIHAQTQLLAFPGGRYGRCSVYELLKLQSSPKILGRLLNFTLPSLSSPFLSLRIVFRGESNIERGGGGGGGEATNKGVKKRK